MRAAMSLVLVLVLAYVGLQLLLGLWVSRRVSSQADYLLGGRSLGLTLCAASMFATWFGAETCIGAAGEVYEHGLAAVSADPFGYGVCLLLFGLLIAGELRRRGYTTIADLFGSRFSPLTERVVALLMIPGSVLWAAAQVRAFGQVLAAASPGLAPELGIALAAGITILYTASGGLLADVYTDLLQGIVLVVTLLALMALVLLKLDGVHASGLWQAGPGAASEAPGPLPSLNAWAIPIAGSIFTQEIISRAVAARTPLVARRSALLAGGVYLSLGLVPVALGLLARQVAPGILESEQVLPLLSRQLLGEAGFVVLAGALISAILSTVDSALLACSALIVHNLAGERTQRWSERARLRLSRAAVISLGCVAFVTASTGLSVHSLVAESSAFASAGLCVAGLLGLFTRFGGARAALLSLASGGVSYVYATFVLESEIAFVLSLGGALGGYALGALGVARGPALEPAPQPARES